VYRKLAAYSGNRWRPASLWRAPRTRAGRDRRPGRPARRLPRRVRRNDSRSATGVTAVETFRRDRARERQRYRRMLGRERHRRRRERAEAKLRSSARQLPAKTRTKLLASNCNCRDADSQFRRTRSGWVARERSGATTVARGGLPIRALAYRGWTCGREGASTRIGRAGGAVRWWRRFSHLAMPRGGSEHHKVPAFSTQGHNSAERGAARTESGLTTASHVTAAACSAAPPFVPNGSLVT